MTIETIDLSKANNLIMSRKFRKLTLRATDGYTGRTSDLLFNDNLWSVQYLVANTGNRFTGHRMLISPDSQGDSHNDLGILDVKLKIAPAANTAKPDSRQYEEQHPRHFGWPLHWNIMHPASGSMYPFILLNKGFSDTTPEKGRTEEQQSTSQQDDPHLRSMNIVSRHRLLMSGGKTGDIEDFVINKKSWKIEYLLVRIHNWLSDRQIVIPSRRIGQIDCPNAFLYSNRPV